MVNWGYCMWIHSPKCLPSLSHSCSRNVFDIWNSSWKIAPFKEPNLDLFHIFISHFSSIAELKAMSICDPRVAHPDAPPHNNVKKHLAFL